MNNLVKTTWPDFIKAVLAGMAIGIGGWIKLAVDNPILGTFLFAFGLMTIISQGWNLYTGRIGYITKDKIKLVPIYLIGNFIGTWIISFIANSSKYGEKLSQQAYQIIITKCNDNLASIIVMSLLCGCLMYLAVDNYKKEKSLWFVMFPVVIFILCGAEHSVANMFYFTLSWGTNYQLEFFFYLIVMIVFNGLGSIFVKPLNDF